MQQNEEDKLIAEYQATQECYLHYDSFRWQSGSLIVAGAFVFWGFVFQSNTLLENFKALIAVNIIVTLLMTIWILFAFHYRQIYLCKIFRLQELELQLDFLQHRRFDKISNTDLKYLEKGPNGHTLDLALYYLTSLTGLISYFLKEYTCRHSFFFLIPILIIVITTIYVKRNERIVVEKYFQDKKSYELEKSNKPSVPSESPIKSLQ